jgi:hypothetical protein
VLGWTSIVTRTASFSGGGMENMAEVEAAVKCDVRRAMAEGSVLN